MFADTLTESGDDMMTDAQGHAGGTAVRGSKRPAAPSNGGGSGVKGDNGTDGPPGDFLAQIEKMFANQERILTGVIDARFKAVDQTLQTHTVSLQEQKEEIDQLKKDMIAIKEGSTMAGSSSGGVPWQPRFLWVKGFSSFETRRQEGITRAEATAFVEILTGNLPADLKAQLGPISLDGVKSSRIKLPIKNPELCQEIQGCLRNEVQEKGLQWKNREVWISRELAPQEQRRYQTCGKLKSWAESLNLIHIKPSWAPDFAVEAANENRPEAVFVFATVDADGSIHWDENGLRETAGMSAQEAQRLFSVHRR